MGNEYITKNCSIVITQRDDRQQVTDTFCFDDYRTANALINLLVNFNSDHYEHYRDQKEFVPVKVNT